MSEFRYRANKTRADRTHLSRRETSQNHVLFRSLSIRHRGHQAQMSRIIDLNMVSSRHRDHQGQTSRMIDLNMVAETANRQKDIPILAEDLANLGLMILTSPMTITRLVR